MTYEEFKEMAWQLLQTPEGREALLQIMREYPITQEQARELEAKYAKKYGKSINDIAIEMIRSGELDDVQMAECMEMVEGAPELTV